MRTDTIINFLSNQIYTKMRIDAVTNDPYTDQRTQTSVTAPTSTSPDLLTIRADGIRQLDFTNMSHSEYFNWMNEQISSGKIPFGESFPFLALTLNYIPVGRESEFAEMARRGEDDGRRLNLIQWALDEIADARLRNDEATLKEREWMLSAMQRSQGQTLGINTFV